MIVLVDTSVWSLALRRDDRRLTSEQRILKNELSELVREGRARIVGPIRQELLSGIKNEAQFERLRIQLRAFDEQALSAEDYEEAARVSNQCYSKGIAGTAIDFLICAIAMRRQWRVLTADRDFRHYARCVPLQLYEPGERPRR